MPNDGERDRQVPLWNYRVNLDKRCAMITRYDESMRCLSKRLDSLQAPPHCAVSATITLAGGSAKGLRSNARHPVSCSHRRASSSLKTSPSPVPTRNSPAISAANVGWVWVTSVQKSASGRRPPPLRWSTRPRSKSNRYQLSQADSNFQTMARSSQ